MANLATAEEGALRRAFQKVSARSSSAEAQWKKSEPRITRLLYMARRLDLGPLRLRDVAEHFEVSLRTVQRDMDVLLCSDWPIQETDEPGVYRMAGGMYTECMGCILNPDKA